MDSGTGDGGQGGGLQKTYGASRKRDSTYSKGPPLEVDDQCSPQFKGHLSALQLLSMESIKMSKSFTSSPSPAANLKRLQKKPLEMSQNTMGPPSSSPAPVPRKEILQQRQKKKDLLSQLKTTRKMASKVEKLQISPEAFILLKNHGPFSFINKIQSSQAYHGGDLQQVPEPLPKQQDTVLPFKSPLGSVPSSQLSSKRENLACINPNKLITLEVPSSSVDPIEAKPQWLTYQRMIRQKEEEEKRRVELVTCKRLKNIMMLPKAHKWVLYEWFYSDIDRVIFEGENDFEIGLRENFPSLKVRQMSRVEWGRIRGMMDKPRRTSSKYFEEERGRLAVQREMIRIVQRGNKDGLIWGNLNGLPEEVPMMLTVGTRVTARLSKPQDRIYYGTVEGVDPSNYSYWVRFEREGMGVHLVPDYEIRARSPPDMIFTASVCPVIPSSFSIDDLFLVDKTEDGSRLCQKV